MWGYIVALLVVGVIVLLLIKKDRYETMSQLVQSSSTKQQATPIFSHHILLRGLASFSLQHHIFTKLHTCMHQHIVGMDRFLYALYVALLVSGGHVLVEGVPGLAKTKTISLLAKAIDLSYKRIQCTPDMLPSDITGVDIFDPQSKSFRFVHGPLFTQMLLVDEINRTTPKVQSALLEAMQEGQVTVGGQAYDLSQPFMVFATQNPIEQEGTYHLPEAQVDRFLFKILLDYPSISEETDMLFLIAKEAIHIDTLFDGEQLLVWQQEVAHVSIDDALRTYIVRLVQATRNSTLLKWGASPRASLALMHASQAVAWLQGKQTVTREDIHMITLLVLRHRVALTYAMMAQGRTVDDVLVEILDPFVQ